MSAMKCVDEKENALPWHQNKKVPRFLYGELLRITYYTIRSRVLAQISTENKQFYGVNLLMNVDQLPRAERGPAAPGEAAQVPSLLSPVVAPKKRPPQVA